MFSSVFRDSLVSLIHSHDHADCPVLFSPRRLQALASPQEVFERDLVLRSPYSSQPGLRFDTEPIHARHLSPRNDIDSTLRRKDTASNDTICLSDRAVNAKGAYPEWSSIRQVVLTAEMRFWRELQIRRPARYHCIEYEEIWRRDRCQLEHVRDRPSDQSKRRVDCGLRSDEVAALAV